MPNVLGVYNQARTAFMVKELQKSGASFAGIQANPHWVKQSTMRRHFVLGITYYFDLLRPCRFVLNNSSCGSFRKSYVLKIRIICNRSDF